jgi:hypothetical protein
MGAFVFNLYPGSIFAEKDDRGFDGQPLVGRPRFSGRQNQVCVFDDDDHLTRRQRFEFPWGTLRLGNRTVRC